jgi:hypothetical protein
MSTEDLTEDQGERRALRELVAKNACRELVYRIARGIDRMDAALIRSAFHEDATIDYGYFKGSVDDFVAWLWKVLPRMKRTQHCICNVLIELDGDVAHGESYVLAFHDLSKKGEELTTTFGGRYIDRFERRNGVWKNASRTTVSDWNAVVPTSDAWDRSPAGTRHFGRRDAEDVSYRR